MTDTTTVIPPGPPAPPTPPVPPSPPVPPPPPHVLTPCEIEAKKLAEFRLIIQARWEGELGLVNGIIDGAQSKANSYTLGSPCQVAFQNYVNALKAERDRLMALYISAMASDMTIDCNLSNWSEVTHTVDLLLGQIDNIVDLMNKAYRDARKKFKFSCAQDCPEFSDYEPDVNLCNRLTSEAEMTLLSATSDWDAIILKAEQKRDVQTDLTGQVTWQDTKLMMQEIKSCLQANIPADVSCSHKYWEQRKNQRLGAINLMKALAACMKGNLFPD